MMIGDVGWGVKGNCEGELIWGVFSYVYLLSKLVLTVRNLFRGGKVEFGQNVDII